MERSELELALAIRDHGSLSATARAMDVAPSVITKRLAAMESALGLKLFQRTTRRVAPTPEGEALCERAAKLVQDFEALEQDLRERHSEPVGLLRLVSTFGFGRIWLGPALARFQTQHPGVQVQLQLAEQLPDLTVEQYDGAVWLWAPQANRAAEWTSRRLARNQRVLVAAPRYLACHGAPGSPQDLAQHQCLLVHENRQRFDIWSLQRAGTRQALRVRVQGPLSSNSGEVVRDWCLAGRGIMLRSLWDVSHALHAGQLQRVLPQYAMLDADILWLAPQRAQVPRRVRLLVDFLLDEFRAEPWKTAPVAVAVRRPPADAPPARRR
jgi:DNA-binding transcriptional LysR family regulator